MHTLNKTLDDLLARILAGDVTDAVNDCAAVLDDHRAEWDGAAWSEKLLPMIATHPLHGLLQQDPYTARAHAKPRGYAGDAVMLDYLYFNVPPVGTSDLGVKIFDVTTVSPGALAVKWRAAYLGQVIDELAEQNNALNVLSFACGHLREAEFTQALRQGKVRSLNAVDQDPVSLEIVARDYAHLPVVAQQGSVKDILKGVLSFNDLHLAYAAGLYDYLQQPLAQALTVKLFAMLGSGGRLIIPNFLITNPVRGYMESFMDWTLVLRTPEDIQALTATVPADEVATTHYHQDPFGVVGYQEIIKK